MFNTDVVLRQIACLLLLWIGVAAKHVSPNFEVEAPTEAIARQVSETAERSRRELAVEWLGHELPNWSSRCQVRVKVGQIGAGGATTFSFAEGEVFGWNMTVQGSLERILDSVIPHEVSHTIFACHFRRPLPRWADEGAATLAEEDSERRRQQKLAEEVLPTSRRIPLRELLQITEYPKNMQHVLTLYAEGYSLVDYLVQQRGKRRFLTFVQEAHELGWEAALDRHYGEKGLDLLESKWSQWVIAGSPSLPSDSLVADVSDRQVEVAVRSQNPESAPIRKRSRESLERTLASSATSDRTLASAAAGGGHSIGSRGQKVAAPAPRRSVVQSAGSADSELTRSPFAISTDVAANDSLVTSRLPRGSHLSRPEWRQQLETNTASTLRQSAATPSSRVEVGTADTTAPRERGESSGRLAGRPARQVVPLQPVQERKSSLHFKPFPSR